jgi:hypothetical protein
VDTPPDDGPVREQLIALLTAQADLIENAPLQLTTLSWLAMGSITPDPGAPPDSGAVTSLRAQVIRRYREPFDHILTSPEARAHLGDLDTSFAIIQLLGPIVFARQTALYSIHHDDCARLVDDFLTPHPGKSAKALPRCPIASSAHPGARSVRIQNRVSRTRNGR